MSTVGQIVLKRLPILDVDFVAVPNYLGIVSIIFSKLLRSDQSNMNKNAYLNDKHCETNLKKAYTCLLLSKLL